MNQPSDPTSLRRDGATVQAPRVKCATGIRNYELLIRNYELLIRNYELLIRNYELVIRNYELRNPTHFEVQGVHKGYVVGLNGPSLDS